MSDYDNPYASSTPERVPSKPKMGLKFTIGADVLAIGLAIGAVIIVVFAFLLPSVNRERLGQRRTQCRNNLKQIALAVRRYHDTHHAFPPAYTVDSHGKPLHSWRTLILPYLDQRRLYEKIDLTKAWGDPLNAEAFKTNVAAFHCPSFDGPMNHTTYMAVVGSRSCFRSTEPRPLSEITDNHGETLMVVEVASDKSVNWMAPRDLRYL